MNERAYDADILGKIGVNETLDGQTLSKYLSAYSKCPEAPQRHATVNGSGISAVCYSVPFSLPPHFHLVPNPR